MTFIVESGSLEIYDDTASGTPKVFDSDWRMFHITNGISAPITGTVSTSVRTATRVITSSSSTSSNTPVDLTTTYGIASVHAQANTVRGQFFVSTSGLQYGISGIGWFDAAGTYVHYLNGNGSVASGAAGNAALNGLAAYTFVASGGSLYLHERIRLDAPRNFSNGTYNHTLAAVTFQYSLRVGTFT